PGHRWRWTVMASLPVTAQTAGKGAARAAARRRGTPASQAASRRPGWVTYLLLGFALVISIFPLYYTLVLGSSTQTEIAQHAVPQWLPDLSLLDRFATIISDTQINFGKALLNSVIISVVASLSVVLFSTLAGFAFAKLRFAWRRGLLVFVIATMAVPTQL